MFLELSEAKVRCREVGREKAGIPALFVHGAGASSAIWLPLLSRVGRRRRAVAFDLPGHGRSSGAVRTVEEMRDAVGGVAAALCLPRAVLVGHSMGGLVALSAALTWPDRVAALVLIATAARIRVSPVLLQAIEREWPRWPELLSQAAYSLHAPPDVRRRGAGIAVAAEKEQTLADFRAVAAVDLRPRLHEIACPTLVVTGEDDVLVPPGLAGELVSGIGGARLVSLSRCGHMPMHEQPDRLAEAVIEFVESVTPRPAAG